MAKLASYTITFKAEFATDAHAAELMGRVEDAMADVDMLLDEALSGTGIDVEVK